MLTVQKKNELIKLKEEHLITYNNLIDQGASFAPMVEGFNNLFRKNLKHLFVISSGDGAMLSSTALINVGGIGLSSDRGKYKVYPAILSADNIIKVAAVDAQNNIAPYSNYSLENIDLAASVEANTTAEEPLNSTAFATAKVSRVADQILKLNPALGPKQVREVLMKSCDVIKIKESIKASIEFNLNGKDSKTYNAMYNRKRKIRTSLKKEIGNILLVKSGGVLNSKRALACAQIHKDTNLDIESSCLKAQSKDKSTEHIKQLKVLWRTRNI